MPGPGHSYPPQKTMRPRRRPDVHHEDQRFRRKARVRVVATDKQMQAQAKGGVSAHEAVCGRGGLLKKFRWRCEREGILHDLVVAATDPKPSTRRREKRRRARGRQD